jgi:arginase
VDAHADFATPQESRTGSAASMCLGLAVGRGDTPLSRLAGAAPLVDARDVALVGRRDVADARYGHAALAESPVLDLPDTELLVRGFANLAAAALGRVASPDVRGFWIHLDVDVINPAVMQAVDSPERGGPMPDELRGLLTPLVQHSHALGMSLSIYDPALDPDREYALQLVNLLETLFTLQGTGRR